MKLNTNRLSLSTAKKRGNILLLMPRFNSEVCDTGFTKVNQKYILRNSEQRDFTLQAAEKRNCLQCEKKYLGSVFDTGF